MTIPSTLGFRTTVEILGRTARLRRQLGNSALVYAIARRAVQRLRLARFVRIYAAEVYCLSLTENDSMAPPLRRFQVRAAGEPDTAALMAYYGTPKLVQRRMDRGDTCFIAESKSEIGAAVWISLCPRSYDEDTASLNASFHLAEGSAWSFDGKGTAFGAWGVLMQQLPAMLLRRHVRRVFSQIERDNWRSIQAHRSLGYEALGRLICCRVMRLAFSGCKANRGSWQSFPLSLGGLEIRHAETLSVPIDR
jgi:hypothetical protein